MSDVLFLEDVARLLRTSVSTIRRARRAGVFPIRELRTIDKRPRWSRAVVERYTNGQTPHRTAWTAS